MPNPYSILCFDILKVMSDFVDLFFQSLILYAHFLMLCLMNSIRVDSTFNTAVFFPFSFFSLLLQFGFCLCIILFSRLVMSLYLYLFKTRTTLFAKILPLSCSFPPQLYQLILQFSTLFLHLLNCFNQALLFFSIILQNT